MNETGLYYLQSRYYNPIVGRFVNEDNAKFLGVNGDIFGGNLFAYCNNNCVNKTELNGNFIAQIVMALVGALIGAASYLIGYFIEKNFFNKRAKISWLAFSFSVIAGAIDGVFSFSKLTKLVGALVGFINEFFPSFFGKDGIIEAFVCAVLAALVSLFLGGTNMLNHGKSKYYTYVLLKKLKSNNWALIKKGVKTFFRKIFKHLKNFIKISSINALFSIGNHTSVKAVKNLKKAL